MCSDRYFAFLFIQVFLVVSLSSGLSVFFSTLAKDPTNVFGTLANSLPKAATYFFSYLMIQSLGNSASDLLQVMPLVMWFLWVRSSSLTIPDPRSNHGICGKASNQYFGSITWKRAVHPSAASKIAL